MLGNTSVLKADRSRNHQKDGNGPADEAPATHLEPAHASAPHPACTDCTSDETDNDPPSPGQASPDKASPNPRSDAPTPKTQRPGTTASRHPIPIRLPRRAPLPLLPLQVKSPRRRHKQPLIIRKRQKPMRPNNHHQVIPLRPILPRRPKRLPQQPLDPVPRHRPTNLPAHRQTQPRFRQPVRPRQHRQRASVLPHPSRMHRTKRTRPMQPMTVPKNEPGCRGCCSRHHDNPHPTPLPAPRARLSPAPPAPGGTSASDGPA